MRNILLSYSGARGKQINKNVYRRVSTVGPAEGRFQSSTKYAHKKKASEGQGKKGTKRRVFLDPLERGSHGLIKKKDSGKSSHRDVWKKTFYECQKVRCDSFAGDLGSPSLGDSSEELT